MCGICGFLDPKADPVRARAVLEAMTASLIHRGPDDGKTALDVDGAVGLGHRRLSILELSPLGAQPMTSADGRFTIVYNGELYNFRELREALTRLGTSFRGHSDTEVLLGAISRWGIAGALERFNGMFAFALWDRDERVLHLARDRLGEKPLYYGWTNGVFLFGSELKALRRHPSFDATVDRAALALYMRHGYVPGPFSIYAAVRKLPPGTRLAVALDGRKVEGPTPYWSARELAERGLRDPFRGGETEAIEELDRLLLDAVRLRMVSDVPLGAFLSGGIDSSTVVALMQSVSPRPVRTFSIGHHEHGYDEAQHARRVAAHLGTEHTELYVTPEAALGVIPLLPGLYDEPFADSSQVPTFLVSQLARRDVTVCLSGDGGDELFCGYERYFWIRRMWGVLRWAPPAVRGLGARAVRAVPRGGWARLGSALAPFVDETRYSDLGDKLEKLAELVSRRDLQDLYLDLITHWRDPAEVVLGASVPTTPLTTRDAWRTRPTLMQLVSFLDTITYLPDDILVKVDRASMGVSLEARVPLLDHRVVELAMRLPDRMKVRGGVGKWILRAVLARRVPASLVDRPKMGFRVPLADWLRGPLRSWAEALLDPERIRREGFFDVVAVRQKWTEHLSGARRWEYLLWDVLMFQAWLEATAS